MEWTTFLATVLGAAIAMGAPLLVEVRKERREAMGEWRNSKRELHGAYLGALSAARGELQLIMLDRARPDAERAVAARQAFARCYELRYQIEVIAPRAVVESALAYFRSMRRLRRAAEAGAEDGDEECENAFHEVMNTLAEVRAAMRLDMGTDSLATD